MVGVRKLKVTNRAHRLVVELFTDMYEQQVNLNVMADKSGNSCNALTDWRTRTNPNVASLDACFNVVGKKLIAVPMDFDETKINDAQPICESRNQITG